VEKTKLNEVQLKNWVSLVFRIGVIISLTLIVIGSIILIYISGFKDMQPLVKLEQIPAAIVISIGILVLLLVPLLQVVLSVVFFSINKNRVFIGISLAVFCLAAISLILLLPKLTSR
jgi:uncharacterized membrane protein